MKREIICQKCVDAGVWGKPLPAEDVEQGIERRTVDGKARSSCRCDQCNAMIEEGESCRCVTIGHGPEIAWDWEKEYLQQPPRNLTKNLGQPTSRAQLDAMLNHAVKSCGCGKPERHGIVLRPKCHPQADVTISYIGEGRMVTYCKQCDERVIYFEVV